MNKNDYIGKKFDIDWNWGSPVRKGATLSLPTTGVTVTEVWENCYGETLCRVSGQDFRNQVTVPIRVERLVSVTHS